MAKNADPGGPGPNDPLRQHPMVSGLRSDPNAPSEAVTELIGFPGDTARDGYQRLYLSTGLDYYVEFPVSDIRYASMVPADVPPFLGHEVTRVSVVRGARIDYTWSTEAGEDDFDLDVRYDDTLRDNVMLEMSGHTSCAPCYSMGISCNICPSHHACHSHGHCH
ncbi:MULTISPECIES: hypothetical protein [Mycobacteriaceae]|uniref:hypothetical protein n=1 Tax=Mycobacteriaceae TaxID=1762 RepID=UPI0007FF4419|nr:MULTISPECIES: hypothetical protein [Mycobacteriaceae]MCK0175959.1 hypothetical protein [Mycolicibacterium sp. F2034L]OBB58563.1 hypothetical protein A5757_16395 [Mycobacterium sp. 852013-51886_SCH5428379]